MHKLLYSLLAVIVLLFFSYLMIGGLTHARDRIDLCDQLGGKLIETKGYGSFCVDRSVIIDITGAK